MESGPWLWLLIVFGGALILGLAIAYGTAQSRKRNPPELERAGREATRRMYHDEED